ncbi:MAG: TIGR00730 family Rossman fold protein [Anaerolineae bacterium]|nr:TIGR00730 family Rossman fold protein [Anaerolineae bacterium]
MKRVCIFCGSYNGVRTEYAEMASVLATGLAERGIEIVYGGSKVGLMGIVADAALAAGGKVIGVIPKSLMDRELAHARLTALHVVGTMHERKALMAELSDGFIALPGGFGTLDELFEIVTWAQLGLHRKPIALLNVLGFYAPLIEMAQHLVREGFVTRPVNDLIVAADNPQTLLNTLETYVPPYVDKWIKKEDL